MGVTRAEIVVIVEAGFADREPLRVRGARPESATVTVQFLVRVMRCVPTEQKTLANRSAMASTFSCCRTRVEIVTMRRCPLPRRAPQMVSSSPSKSGKSK